MRLNNGELQLAPTDLSNYANCRHLTSLDILVEKGELERPERYSPVIEALRERGIAHEQAYLAHLKTQFERVAQLGERPTAAETLAAMQSGADVIYQARLEGDRWGGYADFLVRVDNPSNFGDWSYEVQDSKLARETKAGTLLQLSAYSYLLGELQGLQPGYMHVISPGRDWVADSHRVNDYAAYFRLLERGLVTFTQAGSDVYPEPVQHCDYCTYWARCNKRRRVDDHLGFVAGMSTGQAEHLRINGLATLESFAKARSVPSPERGNAEVLARLQRQAQIQLKGREQRSNEYEVKLPVDVEHGFSRLPEPNPGDIYLDFEGNHFSDSGVTEYLTGYVEVNPDGTYAYTGLWADTELAEQKAYEAFIDRVTALRLENPKIHVYHFAPYEPAALKRLMGRFACREVELDKLLVDQVFVDLLGVTKRTLIASVESYSIKNLEVFFGYERKQNLREASASRRVIEAALESGKLDGSLATHKQIVTDYNREDRESTHRLHIWLEQLRAAQVQATGPIPRFVGREKEEKEPKPIDLQLQAIRDALIKGLPPQREDRTEEQQAQFLLGHIMEFHRREEKAAWWEFFRLRDLEFHELKRERRAVADLTFQGVVKQGAAPLIRYSFPPQDVDARQKDDVYDSDGTKIGSVLDVEHGNRFIDLKHRGDARDARPTHVYFHSFVGVGPIRESLLRLGQHVLDNGLAPVAPYLAALQLLCREPPRFAMRQSDEDTLQSAVRMILALASDAQGGVLAIQGPPGAGKTFTGAEMICALVSAGKTVGVSAGSHRVIHNLMEKAADAAAEKGQIIQIGHYPGGSGKYQGNRPIQNLTKYPEVHAKLDAGDIQVIGGTQWMWSREEFVQKVDVLIVDEAGQMALANVLAAAPAARALVMLGDPQQLEQPIQSAHPEGSEVAGLKHWLGEHSIMPADLGLFLDKTWRLHPDVCSFTSEVYYEGALTPKEDLVNQSVEAGDRLAGAGLRYVGVEHSGNTAVSVEEVAVVERLVDSLLAGGSRVTGKEGSTRQFVEEVSTAT